MSITVGLHLEKLDLQKNFVKNLWNMSEKLLDQG